MKKLKFVYPVYHKYIPKEVAHHNEKMLLNHLSYLAKFLYLKCFKEIVLQRLQNNIK